MEPSRDYGPQLWTNRVRRSAFSAIRDIPAMRVGTSDESTTGEDIQEWKHLPRGAENSGMANTNRTAGIIIGSSIAIGVILSVLLFTLFCLYTRRSQRKGYSPAKARINEVDRNIESGSSGLVGCGWIRSLWSSTDDETLTVPQSAINSRPPSSKTAFAMEAPEMPVSTKAATVLGLAEDAHSRPYGPYNRASTPYDRCSDTASTRGIHTLTPRVEPTMDDAFNELAVELFRGAARRPAPNDRADPYVIPNITPTVFPEDVPIRTTPTTQRRCDSPVRAPPRDGDYRNLAGTAEYNPHHSRYPEGAFF